MKIAIHQPEFCSYLGLFDKISKVDALVIADSFQVKKNYYDNRNKIRTSQGWQWITIPIEKDNHKSFNEVKVMHGCNWQLKMLNAIKQNYSKAKYFNKYYPEIAEVIKQNHKFLVMYNILLLMRLLHWMNVDTKIIGFTSEMNLASENGSDKCLEICKKVGASAYLSGVSGREYLDAKSFFDAGIQLEFQDFKHPAYDQVYKPFIPGLSVIDYLINMKG
jgi:hypothetical protein